MSTHPECDAVPRRGPFHHYVVEDWIKLAHSLEDRLLLAESTLIAIGFQKLQAGWAKVVIGEGSEK